MTVLVPPVPPATIAVGGVPAPPPPSAWHPPAVPTPPFSRRVDNEVGRRLRVTNGLSQPLASAIAAAYPTLSMLATATVSDLVPLGASRVQARRAIVVAGLTDLDALLAGVPGLTLIHRHAIRRRFSTVEDFLDATDTAVLGLCGLPVDTAVAIAERRRRPETGG